MPLALLVYKNMVPKNTPQQLFSTGWEQMKHLGFLFKNKNQKDPTKEAGKMFWVVNLNREWHFPGGTERSAGDGEWHQNKCACPRGSPVAVHDWSWIHTSAWPEGLPDTLGWQSRKEKLLGKRDSAVCVSRQAWFPDRCLWSLWMCDQRDTLFLTTSNAEESKGWGKLVPTEHSASQGHRHCLVHFLKVITSIKRER